MPPRTRKKPTPEAEAHVVIEEPRRFEPPPLRAGKPDTSVASYYSGSAACVTYTDRWGNPHREECAHRDVRATTVRLALAHGGGNQPMQSPERVEAESPPLERLPKGRDLLLHVLSKVRVLGMAKGEEAHIIQPPAEPHVFRVVAASRDGNRPIANLTAKEIARLGEGEVLEIDKKGSKRIIGA